MSPEMRDFIDANQPVTALQVAQALGISRTSFYEQSKAGAVHIVAWTRVVNGQSTALYELGPGEDVPRPRAIGVKERQKAYRKRNRALLNARRPSKAMLKMGVWNGLGGT